MPQSHAYSVLTHEEVVDLMWASNIVPLLKQRFPQATDDDIRRAHAYAYGGSVIQDIGYYPWGSHYFSDLLHYVRTGDFVSALIADSTDIEEYAFALGALAHYCGDTIGHPYINEATSAEYPKLRKRYGNIVTYEEDPVAHLRTEFGFDVVQVAHNRFASDAYRDFIGFQVARPLLHRAFLETYGIKMDDVMTHEELAIGSYRRSVSHLIPHMTKVALVAYGKQLKAEDPSFDRKKFIYRIKRSEYRKEFGKEYKEPGIGSRLLALLVMIVPKIGPFRALRLSLPSPQEENIYLKSVNLTVDCYQAHLMELQQASAVRYGPPLPDMDLDTGKPTAAGEYRLADYAYAKLLEQVTEPTDPGIPIAVHDQVLAFYANPSANNAVMKDPVEWRAVQEDLLLLRAAKLIPPPVIPASLQ
ncbi:MAG: zinc dependent phospholipase C family protein [Acidobacteriaceae bacterium]|nr:zinc dependent phospholipase C family protein [Acidobacteriaceae bacterium]